MGIRQPALLNVWCFGYPGMNSTEFAFQFRAATTNIGTHRRGGHFPDTGGQVLQRKATLRVQERSGSQQEAPAQVEHGPGRQPHGPEVFEDSAAI
jgi:hypothetical protein